MSKQTPSGWPNGKKVAVSLNIMFETWSEGKGPANAPHATALKPPAVDLRGWAWGSYGGKVGIWRLLHLLDELQIPATFFTSGRCAEVHPEAVKQIVRCGHDLGAHSYAQDIQLPLQTPEEQRKNIRTSIDLLQDCTGHKVTGWASPSVAWTHETNDQLAEAGLKWQTDVTYLDLPTRIPTPHGIIVGVPTTDMSDNTLLKANPRGFFDAHRSTFDYLERYEPMSMQSIVVHAAYGGRPMVTAVIEETLRHMQKSPNVWFAPAKELAQWALDSDRDEHTYEERFFSTAADSPKRS